MSGIILKEAKRSAKGFFYSFCLIFLLSGNIFCQNYPFRQYSVLDGLPQSQVSSLNQDSRGFLWITTKNGLSRFDGIEFVNYYRKDGLLSNSGNSVLEDKSGTIWVISVPGISKYTGNGFVSYPLPPEYNGWVITPDCAVDNRGNLILTATFPLDSTVKLLVFSEGLYSDYSEKVPEIDSLDIFCIEYDQADDQLLLLDSNKKLWIIKDSIPELVQGRKFDRLLSDRGMIFLDEDKIRYSYKDGKFIPYNFRFNRGRADVYFNMESNGTVEFFNGDSLFLISKSFSHTGNYIDREGVLWFTSEGNLYKLLSTAFIGFHEDDTGMRNIWAMIDDKNGHIWFGSLYNKLYEFDGQVFNERVEFKSLYSRAISFYKGSRRMSNGDVCMSTDNGVLIWNGTEFSRLKGIPENTQICYIFEDIENKVSLMGTEKGLFCLKNGVMSTFPEFNDADLGVIEGIAKEESGNYLLSGHHGVLNFDMVNSEPVKEKDLPDLYTYTVAKDMSGGLWVTSEEGLFFRENPDKKFIQVLPEEFNRPANSILLIENNNLLVGRVSDIVLIDIGMYKKNEKNYFRIYDETDGFQGSDCIDNGIIKDLNGRIWILTSDKVIRFDRNKLKENSYPPLLNLTGLYFMNENRDWVQIDSTQLFYGIPDIIKLNRFRNNLRICFTGISTTNPEKVRYRYRLIGYDDKWSLPSAERFAIYERLPPGSYNFQVSAINADGIETEKTLELTFRIMPAFWQTKLAIVLLVVLFFTLSGLLPYLIVRQKQRKKIEADNQKAELSRLQMSSVIKQFDPHFTFNVISSVGSMIMKGEKEAAYEYITKLSSLLRTVLSDGSLIIGPLSDEVDFVRKYCELQRLRFKERFNFEIKIGEDVNLFREIPKMTIQTFVENAIKHGFENRNKGGSVKVLISNVDNSLVINIIDDGIGRAEASKQQPNGSGSGIRIVRNLFDLMNKTNDSRATIEIVDNSLLGRSSGTEVIIRIPNEYNFENNSNRSDNLY